LYAYKAASEQYTVPIDKIRKIPGITESIVSLSKHTFTPFHLGLAVQLYHEFDIVSVLISILSAPSLYETSTLTDRNNAIWDINALFDAVFLFQSNYRDNRWQGHFPFYGNGSLSSMPITYRLYATDVYQKEQR
jgi:hypothetical protein